MKEGTTVLEHLNFFNKVISELITVDVKLDKEDKALILLASESYDHIVTTMLYGNKTSILEEELSYLMGSEKHQIKLIRKDQVWWKEIKVPVHQRRVTFVNMKVTGRKTTSINKNG